MIQSTKSGLRLRFAKIIAPRTELDETDPTLPTNHNADILWPYVNTLFDESRSGIFVTTGYPIYPALFLRGLFSDLHLSYSNISWVLSSRGMLSHPYWQCYPRLLSCWYTADINLILVHQRRTSYWNSSHYSSAPSQRITIFKPLVVFFFFSFVLFSAPCDGVVVYSGTVHLPIPWELSWKPNDNYYCNIFNLMLKCQILNFCCLLW